MGSASPLNPFPADRRGVMPWEYQWSVFAKANPLKPGDSWIDPRFSAYDISGFDLMRQKGESEPVIDLACGVGSVYGTNVYDFSMLAVFHSLRWGAEQASFGPGAFAVKGGNQRLPEAMARALTGRIETGKVVRAVSTDGSGVEVRCDDGTSYRARALVMTLPFTAMRSVRFEPVLTGVQAEAVQLLGYSTALQVHFAVKRAYWKDDGLPPDMWTDGPVGKLAALRYGDDPEEVTTVLAYVNGAQGERLDRMAPDAAAAEMLAFLARARPSTKGALTPVKVVSWQRDPFSGGVYCAYKPGQISRYIEPMAKPHGWVHFAGEHTAITNRGMEGAMESGERAAGELLARL